MHYTNQNKPKVIELPTVLNDEFMQGNEEVLIDDVVTYDKGAVDYSHNHLLTEFALYLSDCAAAARDEAQVEPEVASKTAYDASYRWVLVNIVSSRMRVSVQKVLSVVLPVLTTTGTSQSNLRYVMWHVDRETSDASTTYPGFCYTSLVRDRYVAAATARLGAWPNIASILLSPRVWFDTADGISARTVYTDDLAKPFPALKSCTALAAFMHCAAKYPFELPVESFGWWLRHLDVYSSADLQDMPQVVDRVGGRPLRWHISKGGFGKDYVWDDGDCYLELFKFRHHAEVRPVLKSWPTFRSILSMPQYMVRNWRKLEKVYVVRSVGSPVAFTARTILQCLSHQVENPPEGSYAQWVQTTVASECPEGIDLPALDGIIGGVDHRSLEHYEYWGFEVKGYIPPLDSGLCEEVVTDALAMWGVDDTEDTRDSLVECLAQVLAKGSNNVVLESAKFCLAGWAVDGHVFLQALRVHCAAENSLRLWARSYRNGLVCAAISEQLGDETNVVLRMQAASKYRVGLRYVHLCFDLVKTYARTASLRYDERVFVRLSKYARFMPVRLAPGVSDWFGVD